MSAERSQQYETESEKNKSGWSCHRKQNYTEQITSDLDEVDKQQAWSQPHASNMKNMQGKWTGLSSRAAGEGHLVSQGWLHMEAFLFVPKLQCGGGNGENSVWRVDIRSRHVPWHDSELPVGMTLFFVLLNRIIFFVFWPVLCLFLYFGRAGYKTLLACS